MTMSDLGAFGSFLAAIAVFVTLLYLARQVRQGNVFARYQVRQAMMEQDLSSLKLQIEHVDIPLNFTNENPGREELMRLHLFLTHIMRQREWEWFQFKDGLIDESVYKTYHEVIAIFLATPLTRDWWEAVGRSGMTEEFASDVDSLLSQRQSTDYWERARKFHR